MNDLSVKKLMEIGPDVVSIAKLAGSRILKYYGNIDEYELKLEECFESVKDLQRDVQFYSRNN